MGVEGRLGLGGGKVGSGWREERVRSRWREGWVHVEGRVCSGESRESRIQVERTVQWVRVEGRVGLGGGNGGSGWRVSMEGRLGLGGGKGACTYLGSTKKRSSNDHFNVHKRKIYREACALLCNAWIVNFHEYCGASCT